MGKEWIYANTLDDCMALASEEAAHLDLLVLFPPELSPLLHTASSPPSTTSSTSLKSQCNYYSPSLSFPSGQIKSFQSQNFCFQCLSPIFPGPTQVLWTSPTHQFLLNHSRPLWIAAGTTLQLIYLQFIIPPLSYWLVEQAPALFNLPPDSTIEHVDLLHDVTVFNELIEDKEKLACATVDIQIATVHVRLDCSLGGAS